MSSFPPLHMGTDIALVGVMNGRISPHPVPLPMGEGTVLHAPSIIQAYPLPWGEGQGEGSELRSWHGGATAGAYASPSFSSRTLAP